MTTGQHAPGIWPPAAGADTSSAVGRVLTAEGWPVAGATVTVLGVDGAQLGRAVGVGSPSSHHPPGRHRHRSRAADLR